MMKNRLGLFQISQNRFAVAIHNADDKPLVYQEFSIADANVRFNEGRPALQLSESENSDLHEMTQFTLHSLEKTDSKSIDASLMSLNTASDWIGITVLPNGTAAYRVVLAMARFAPIVCNRIDKEFILYVRQMLKPDARSPSFSHILHPALLLQCAEIYYPHNPLPADSCASLAARPEILDYLTALGDTFSITDIEQLAKSGQTSPSGVLALVDEPGFLKGYQTYNVSLGERAIENQELLTVSYARARAQHAKGLLERTRNRTGTSADDEYYTGQIDRYSHHLAILHVCTEFDINLSVEPFTRME